MFDKLVYILYTPLTIVVIIINPSEIGVITQPSYHKSAINPIESQFFLVKSPFSHRFHGGLHLVDVAVGLQLNGAVPLLPAERLGSGNPKIAILRYFDGEHDAWFPLENLGYTIFKSHFFFKHSVLCM